MSRTRRRRLAPRTLLSLALLWTAGLGPARAGEIVWEYDTGG